MTKYPLTPKSARTLRPGHFWPIKLDDGRYACGIVIEPWPVADPASEIQIPGAFYAALLDWTGEARPKLEDIETISEVICHGTAGVKAVTIAGEAIAGKRDLERFPVVLSERVTHRSGGQVWVIQGTKRVRLANRREAAEMPTRSGMGVTAMQAVANSRWVDSQG